MKNLIFFVLLSPSAFAAPNYWPPFYGRYTIDGWTCESVFRDPGCRDSAVVKVYELNGVTMVDVFDVSGRVLRSNELVDKVDGHTSYTLGGSEDSPTFTVESKDSRGKRFFYNVFEITRAGFTHVQESDLGGVGNSFRRQFHFSTTK